MSAPGDFLTLAAEDCDPQQFAAIHRFSAFEKKLIRTLIAHGPVLLRGGRGSGKSALFIEADRQMSASDDQVFSVYVSLRSLPLLRSEGKLYEKIFCEILIGTLRTKLQQRGHDFSYVRKPYDAGELHSILYKVATTIKRRIVLMFDDAAHIGRETALTEFFDIFRTISSNLVSCKATIYPGVTKFGVRFDIFNDATVLDVARDERSPEFNTFFYSVLEARFGDLAHKFRKGRSLNGIQTAALLGRAVIGNMRAFVFACSWLNDRPTPGLPDIREVMLKLASDYYWPLLDEVAPKLGPYETLIPMARNVAEDIYRHAGSANTTSVTVHREIVQKLSKLFEILEYVGFMSKREASRSMKSGGRGPRFCLNLATLLESTPQSQLTVKQVDSWISTTVEPAEFHVSGSVLPEALPDIDEDADMAIMNLPISSLKQGKTYLYGLTDHQITLLENAEFLSIKDVADAEDDDLIAIDGVGEKIVARVRAVVGQAIWM